MLRRREVTVVDGVGFVTRDGVIILDQTVRRGSRHPTKRQWRLRPNGAGGLTGTLTDAIGPVIGKVEGNCLHLAFSMKGGIAAEQWLYLNQSRMIAQNVVIFRTFGMRVARLDETITKDSADSREERAEMSRTPESR